VFYICFQNTAHRAVFKIELSANGENKTKKNNKENVNIKNSNVKETIHRKNQVVNDV
jgi:hypothetical protein